MHGPTSSAADVTAKTRKRLASLDALRGFDMFWIIGADALGQALRGVSSAGPIDALARQLDHADWAGFRFYDLIFPLFVFIVGVSLVFSLGRTMAERGRPAAINRIIRRTALLYLLALLYYGGLSHHWPDIRLVGVLNRIALCYFAAALAFCFLSRRGLAILCAGVLVGYWALMTFVPFPDVRPAPGGSLQVCRETGFTNVSQLNLDSSTRISGVFIKGVNLANYVDQRYLPGMKWDGTWDPEGLLSTLPAIGSCLLGVLAGLWLENRQHDSRRKVLGLVLAGGIAVILGWLWGRQFPVIKKIWTSSYVLVAGGYSALLLAVFYWIIDVRNWRRWSQPFIWIGMNPITLYLAVNVVDVEALAQRFAGGDLKDSVDRITVPGMGNLLLAAVGLGLVLALARFLYRRGIFLRV